MFYSKMYGAIFSQTANIGAGLVVAIITTAIMVKNEIFAIVELKVATLAVSFLSLRSLITMFLMEIKCAESVDPISERTLAVVLVMV